MNITIKKLFSKYLSIFCITGIVILWIFPVIYIYLTSFKTEETVVPPNIFITNFTLENYKDVLTPEILPFIKNSFMVALGSVLFSLLLGVPVAYRLVFGTMKNPHSLYFWFLSTFILPPVAVLIPALLILKTFGLLDSIPGLIIIYTGTHVPIIIWLTTAFFKDVPKALIEAAYIDGSNIFYSFFKIILPLSKMGIISAGLLVFVFVWNEFFFAINLTVSKANTLPVYMSTFLTQEGLFWAKLSAIASVVILPTIILGMFSQKALVKGLTSGAVKG